MTKTELQGLKLHARDGDTLAGNNLEFISDRLGACCSFLTEIIPQTREIFLAIYV